MTPSERQCQIVTGMKLIREILWDMEWFGNFGVRQKYLKKQIEELTDILKRIEL